MGPIHPKLGAAAIGGALATTIVWVVGLLGLHVPSPVAAAWATLLAALLGYWGEAA